MSRAGSPVAGPAARRQRARGRHRRLESQHGGDRRRGAVERPVESAERDHRRADGALREHDHLRQAQAAAGGRIGERPEHRHVGANDQQQAPHAPASRAAASLRTAARADACGARRSDRSSSRRARRGAAPSPGPDRPRAGTRSRRRAARRALRRCCGRARPRSRAAASASPARRRRARSGAHHA